MIPEDVWVQYWSIEYRRGRDIHHTTFRIPYIQPVPDHNVWLEVLAKAEDYLSSIELLTAIIYVNSRKRYYEEEDK